MMVSELKKHNVDFDTDLKIVKRLYYEFCEELKIKYGEINVPFDSSKIVKRPKEWLDIHHICEIDSNGINKLDNIAVRTNKAIKENNTAELKRLEPYNKADQLIYANKIEHFVLHYLIDIYRGVKVASGGCWLILSNIFDMEYKTDFKLPNLIEIQKNKDNYYTKDEFNYLFKLARILRIERGDDRYDRFIVKQSMFVSNTDKYFKMLGLI